MFVPRVRTYGVIPQGLPNPPPFAPEDQDHHGAQSQAILGTTGNPADTKTAVPWQ